MTSSNEIIFLLVYFMTTLLLIIPESKIKVFKQLLINYYEDKDSEKIIEFMKKFCWKTF